LQRDVSERRFAVVADGDEGADRDVLIGSAQVHVHVKGDKGHSLAFGVIGGGALTI